MTHMRTAGKTSGNFRIPRPNQPLEFTGERMTSAVDGQIEFEHYHRYCMARDLCANFDVLDVASGEGYGAALLAHTARSVTGVEIDAATVKHAKANYIADNLRFMQGDALALPLGDDSVDVVVSFETLEHVSDQELFIAEVRRVLRDGGLFIVSTPDRHVYSSLEREPNPYHVLELSCSEFTDLLEQKFTHSRILSQRPILGSVLALENEIGWRGYERRSSELIEASDGLPRADYLIGIATDGPLPSLCSSVYIDRRRVHHVVEDLRCISELRENATRLSHDNNLLRSQIDHLDKQYRGAQDNMDLLHERLRDAQKAHEHRERRLANDNHALHREIGHLEGQIGAEAIMRIKSANCSRKVQRSNTCALRWPA